MSQAQVQSSENSNSAINQIVKSLTEAVSLLETLRVREVVTPSAPVWSPNKFKKLLFRDAWPRAVASLPDPNSDHARAKAASSVLDRVLERDICGKTFLDTSCGSGDLVYASLSWKPKLAVGIDERRGGWNRFSKDPRMVLTTDFDIVKDTQYDVIFSDGLSEEDLETYATLLKPGGLFYVTCRPWVSRYGMGIHNLRVLNKAFAHLYLSDSELASIGYHDLPRDRVIDVDVYRRRFRQSGLKVRREKIHRQPVEKVFETAVMTLPLNDLFGTKEFQHDRLSICSVVYTLERK